MKKFFILSVMILSVCTVFASENTLVPKAQLPEIKSAVFANALKTVRKCNKPVISEINPVSELGSLKKNNEGKVIFGEWVEEWTINACGTEVIVPVEFKQQFSAYSGSKNIKYSNSYLKYKIREPRVK